MIEEKKILEKISTKIISQTTIHNSERSNANRDEVLNKITATIAQSERLMANKLRIAIGSIAAVVACAVIYSVYINTNQTSINTEINYSEIAQNFNPESKEVTICLNNDPSIEIENNSNIEHTTSGEMKINEQIIDNTQSSDKKQEISQVIVPKSKRAEITLSDGTKVKLNSDSRIIYATNFESNVREVYIEGEAFLDVAKDNGRPFIVKTKKFTINVTGTKFNVTSYDNDQISRVVLVEGKVNIDVADKNRMYLDPGQMMQIDNMHSKIETIDTYKYTCWVDKIMIFENQSLKEVADRVSRFYDIDLVIDPSHANMAINGKLDLKDNVNDVVKTLSLISNLKAEHISNSIILTD